MKTTFIITGLILLIIANLLMSYSMSYMSTPSVDGFMNYLSKNAANTGKTYEPMGKYDGIELHPEGDASTWRNTAPNEPLNGPEFAPGPDSLFMFKNNQCKTECCGASFSCAGGCVCSTPSQRQYIATRGGNRTVDE
jgi:hypothetical protein